MLPRIAFTFVLLTIAIPNVGIGGVMKRPIDSTASVSASTDDTTRLPIEQDCWDKAHSTKGIVSSSWTLSLASSQAMVGCTDLWIKTNPRLLERFGFDQWLFIPAAPVLKVSKVPIF